MVTQLVVLCPYYELLLVAVVVPGVYHWQGDLRAGGSALSIVTKVLDKLIVPPASLPYSIMSGTRVVLLDVLNVIVEVHVLIVFRVSESLYLLVVVSHKLLDVSVVDKVTLLVVFFHVPPLNLLIAVRTAPIASASGTVCGWVNRNRHCTQTGFLERVILVVFIDVLSLVREGTQLLIRVDSQLINVVQQSPPTNSPARAFVSISLQSVVLLR